MQQNGVSQLLKVKLQDAINMIDKEEVKACLLYTSIQEDMKKSRGNLCAFRL